MMTKNSDRKYPISSFSQSNSSLQYSSYFSIVFIFFFFPNALIENRPLKRRKLIKSERTCHVPLLRMFHIFKIGRRQFLLKTFYGICYSSFLHVLSWRMAFYAAKRLELSSQKFQCYKCIPDMTFASML